MPKNKSTKTDDQQNLSSLTEEPVTLKPSKAGPYPANLNNINKNHP
ncbi:hypothetical protein ACFQWB_12595 [Paenibacillus thermoaerophilus]|uniref:Uncharacterized protein n=1 Tax=Paenibacillus thermoaerophilus TaxID=1215385 RepID=A0ABW2V5D6_9BACL|nr:hypothetical protein [Paenibacillus thermoaerophilus]